ncbi:uncharacterized protein LOC131859306 [Cryptomeria japonica]|uniref:uncharacterized protein LOC131859306 n=1 Tax=Cryptomeria japonica TaxID=3369 RepID=UPI0027DA1BE5|nr:uncharacterized protein LOC131859306 [Cryptomeria japonica]
MSIGGKKALWDYLSLTPSPLHGKFVVFGGDFNAISSDDEKCGGIFPNKHILEDFSAFILNNDLVDCKTLNGSFTWTNRRKYFSQIAERLDHFLISDNWISSDVDVVATILPYASSDHFPVVLSIFDDRALGHSSFKFEPMWFRDPSFPFLLQSWWSLAPFVQESEITVEGVRFFKSLLSEESYVFNDNFSSSIPQLIIDEDNAMLMAPFFILEVKDVVFSMSPNKAPGPNGFTTLFFQKCWSFLGEDLHLLLEEARCNRSMLRELNTTLIVLIPKSENPKTFVDFRPISLCNTLYKIITKAIFLRLAKLIPRIASGEQGGFVPGRETTEGAIVAHEILHSISQLSILDMILKLDMMKVYDRKVNQAKSKFFFLNVSPLVQSRLSCFWGFSVGQFPCKYLGLPFFTGLEKHNFWERISGAISSRILPWSHKWLTFSGKIVLIRVVLNAVPIYLLSVLKASNKSMVSLRLVLRSFLWNDNVNKKCRIPLLAWDRVCAHRDKGGARVKDLGKQNLALGAKLV